METKMLENPDNFENKIKSLLKPINPDTAFVNGLQNRLIGKQNIQIDDKNFFFLLPFMIAAGLVSGAFLLCILRRRFNRGKSAY